MFDVMIIDDDKHVRERLASIIEWEQLGARLVCEAEDSDSAVELYKMYRPKLIITDINIPIISGLDLVEQLKDEDPELRFIIITGYNDFEYAQRAANLHVANLLTKPILVSDINESISRALTEMVEERKRSSSVTALQQLVSNNLPEVRQIYMTNLLRKKPKNPELVEEKLETLKIPCNGSHHMVVLISLHTLAEHDNRESIVLLLRDMLKKELAREESCIFAYVNNRLRLNCVISTNLDNPYNIVEGILVRISDFMKQQADVEMNAGVGCVVKSMIDICESYNTALAALNYQLVDGTESITLYNNLRQADIIAQTNDQIFSRLLGLLREGNQQDVENVIVRQVSILRAASVDGEKKIKTFFFEYVTMLTSELISLGFDIDKMDNYALLITKLFQKKDYTESLTEILNISKYFMEQFTSKKITSSNHLIAMAKSYIYENLKDEKLDLEQVANHVGLSKIYFCKLFHQVEGINFSTYLKKERIKKAKKYLLTTNLKVFEISLEVGFSNAKYFSYVFKKTAGITPLEFQKGL